MNQSKAAVSILFQLDDLVRQIKDDDYVRPLPTLSDASVGQHVRHTIEFFLCFKSGCTTGVINYDKRAHDTAIEQDRHCACAAIAGLVRFLETQGDDQPLVLEVGFDPDKEVFDSVATNSTRELVYNIEHAVHHMAIIRIGVRESLPYVALQPGFGIAASTIRFRGTRMSATLF